MRLMPKMLLNKIVKVMQIFFDLELFLKFQCLFHWFPSNLSFFLFLNEFLNITVDWFWFPGFTFPLIPCVGKSFFLRSRFSHFKNRLIELFTLLNFVLTRVCLQLRVKVDSLVSSLVRSWVNIDFPLQNFSLNFLINLFLEFLYFKNKALLSFLLLLFFHFLKHLELLLRNILENIFSFVHATLWPLLFVVI